MCMGLITRGSQLPMGLCSWWELGEASAWRASHRQSGFESRAGASGAHTLVTSFLPLKGLAASVFSNIQMRSDDLPPGMDLSMSCFSG